MTERIGTSTFHALRSLANRWTLKAREFARDAKSSDKGEATAAYNRGLAEGYYKAAVELAEVLKHQAEEAQAGAAATPVAAPPNPPPAAQPAAAIPQPAAPAAPAEMYLPIPLNEVLMILEYAGTNARDVSMNKQNVFTAVFSRWENLMPHERVEKLRKVDMRLIVLNNGKTKDTSDPYVEFAFKDMSADQ